MSPVAAIVGRGWVSNHSARAVMVGSTPALFHHAASSPQRWASRWWPRHSGTVNSSLALRPSARCCVKRKWWASAGRRPQIKHACLATNLTCSLSRKRRGSGWVSRLLSMPSAAAVPAWILAPSATGLSKPDLHVFAKLFEDCLKRGLEAQAFSGREIGGHDDVLNFLVGHFVDVDLTRQPAS